MRVQWYYHPEELQSHIPSFRSELCGAQERILSNHFDVVPTISCNGPVEMVELNEQDPSQELPEDSYFYRLTFHIQRGKKSARRDKVSPFPISCFCRSPYNPDLHIMRWCSNCRVWLHNDCLKNSKSKRSSYLCPDPLPTPPVASSKRINKSFLKNLSSLAHCPIVKGQEFGVVGNFQHVIRAKSLLQQMASEGDSFIVPKDWKEQLGLTGNTRPNINKWRTCPTCGTLI